MQHKLSGRLEILRSALQTLAQPACEQRLALAGAVVGDELALDFDNAYSLIPGLVADGVELRDHLVQQLTRLDQLLGAPSGDAMWADAALDDHPTWVEARALARAALLQLPAAG